MFSNIRGSVLHRKKKLLRFMTFDINGMFSRMSRPGKISAHYVAVNARAGRTIRIEETDQDRGLSSTDRRFYSSADRRAYRKMNKHLKRHHRQMKGDR